MSERQRAPLTAPLVLVRHARRVLTLIMGAAAILWGAAAVIILSLFVPVGIALVVGACVVVGLLWWARGVRSLERVALWIEEHEPDLQYALVTLVEMGHGGEPPSTPASQRLLHSIDATRVQLAPAIARAARRRLGAAALAVIGAVIITVGFGASLRGVGRTLRSGARTVHSGATRLEPLLVTVTPPAYARRATEHLRDPERIRGLEGSTIEIDGVGDRGGVRVQVGSRNIEPVASDAGWRVSAVMPASAALVTLRDTLPRDARSTGPSRRTLLLEPVPDLPPTVVLAAPARDTVESRPSGALELSARAADDIGLADGHFEIIVSSGREDQGGVHDRVLTIGGQRFDTSRSGELKGEVSWSTLGVSPGNVISVRAIVQDGNGISGPGIGVSETRTIRVASREDSAVALEGAAPPSLDSGSLDSTRVTGPRLYLRGAPPRITVDVDRIRLTGSDHPDPGAWQPGAQGNTLRARWVERLTRVADLVGRRAGDPALLDSLLAWRVEIESGSTLVAPLDTAIDLVRAGRDPRSALTRIATVVIGPWRRAEGVAQEDGSP